ncbi:hypothetical protein VNO77_44722 [Canavalia gladiata]|uniref:Uncharacterized protein n=1 Tax=Canavalia gladiata TaxID=3824 RepID=A0AAN9JYY9_CANGL
MSSGVCLRIRGPLVLISITFAQLCLSANLGRSSHSRVLLSEDLEELIGSDLQQVREFINKQCGNRGHPGVVSLHVLDPNP